MLVISMCLQIVFPHSSVVTKFTLEKTSALTYSLVPIQRRGVSKPFAATTTLVWFDLKMVEVYMPI